MRAIEEVVDKLFSNFLHVSKPDFTDPQVKDGEADYQSLPHQPKDEIEVMLDKYREKVEEVRCRLEREGEVFLERRTKVKVGSERRAVRQWRLAKTAEDAIAEEWGQYGTFAEKE
eukprot:TRINITY_DN9140_c0_g1_i4.p2 TRINITY_DN9140_c0_g1~~TRINITY_DN9140_c0_g1_i4.p2  ORF type:complete len:115 (-),score=41.72 TRINITY_DN9140_c0_g1_i4:130-474(-)